MELVAGDWMLWHVSGDLGVLGIVMSISIQNQGLE